jgi:hypothetical protein
LTEKGATIRWNEIALIKKNKKTRRKKERTELQGSQPRTKKLRIKYEMTKKLEEKGGGSHKTCTTCMWKQHKHRTENMKKACFKMMNCR